MEDSMNKMKKVAVAAVFAMALGAGAGAKDAWAQYGIPIAPCSTCSSTEVVDIYGNTSGSPNINTAYTAPTSTSDGIIGANNLVFTPASGLTQVANSVIGYTATSTSGPSAEYSGYVDSSVWRTSSGTLDFFYQFDVTSIGSNASAPNSAGISPFNLPNNTTYNLALGINSSTAPTSSGGTTVTYDPLCIGTNCTPVSLSNFFNDPTPLTLSYGNGGTFIGGNNTPIFDMSAGNVSPQLFIASNATSYGIGTFTIQSSTGIADVAAFVPDSPEPGTLVLFGSALALGSFFMMRKKGLSIV
jgi:hypothetical protein